MSRQSKGQRPVRRGTHSQPKIVNQAGSTDALAQPDSTASTKPQKPVRLFSYVEQEVSFSSSNASLSGTVTQPDSNTPAPAVVLIHGSGGHTRDEVVYGHTVFAVLADHLTSRGIVVLRYDKRGIGASTGEFASATVPDFADDSLAAVEYLKTHPGVDPGRITLIGHSEGGLVAPMVALRTTAVRSIILMNGPALPGGDIVVSETAVILRSQGVSEEEIKVVLAQRVAIHEILKSDLSAEDALQEIVSILLDFQNVTDELRNAVTEQHKLLVTPWYRGFIRYDPRPALWQLTCPVLVLAGEKDAQVLADDNLQAFHDIFAGSGNTQVELIKLPGLNHILQTCNTGLMDEYGELEETLAYAAMHIMADWVLKH